MEDYKEERSRIGGFLLNQQDLVRDEELNQISRVIRSRVEAFSQNWWQNPCRDWVRQAKDSQDHIGGLIKKRTQRRLTKIWSRETLCHPLGPLLLIPSASPSLVGSLNPAHTSAHSPFVKLSSIKSHEQWFLPLQPASDCWSYLPHRLVLRIRWDDVCKRTAEAPWFRKSSSWIRGILVQCRGHGHWVQSWFQILPLPLIGCVVGGQFLSSPSLNLPTY